MNSKKDQENLPADESSEEQRGTGNVSMHEVVEKHRDAIMAMPGVIGLAVGRCREHTGNCLLVYTKSGKWPDELSRELEGFRVEIVKTGGDFRPL
jgi:hypothetical protein